MTIRDAIQLAELGRPPDGVIRCLIYVRISMDKAHDGHGVANQMAKLEHKARERGWTVVYRLSEDPARKPPRGCGRCWAGWRASTDSSAHPDTWPHRPDVMRLRSISQHLVSTIAARPPVRISATLTGTAGLISPMMTASREAVRKIRPPGNLIAQTAGSRPADLMLRVGDPHNPMARQHPDLPNSACCPFGYLCVAWHTQPWFKLTLHSPHHDVHPQEPCRFHTLDSSPPGRATARRSSCSVRRAGSQRWWRGHRS